MLFATLLLTACDAERADTATATVVPQSALMHYVYDYDCADIDEHDRWEPPIEYPPVAMQHLVWFEDLGYWLAHSDVNTYPYVVAEGFAGSPFDTCDEFNGMIRGRLVYSYVEE